MAAPFVLATNVQAAIGGRYDIANNRILFAAYYGFLSAVVLPTAAAPAQLQQLGNLLTHAVAAVPFYGAALSAAGYRSDQPLTWELWARLPILDLKALHTNRDALASRSVPPSHGAVAELRIERGSGSVGTSSCSARSRRP